MNNPALQTQNRFCLPGQKDISFEEAEPVLATTRRLRGTVEEPSIYFATRPSPFEGEAGVIDVGNICVQAAIKTFMNSMSFKYSERAAWTSLFYFLNPPEIGLDRTDYQKRLPLITKIIQEYEHEVCGKGYLCFEYDGYIFDATSMRIGGDEPTTNFVWMGWKSDSKEILINTQRPQNALKYDLYYDESDDSTFRKLRKLHQKDNLFGRGPLEFTFHIGGGYYIPLIGITEIWGIDERFADKGEEVKRVVLDSNGEYEDKFVKERWYLRPERIDYI